MTRITATRLADTAQYTARTGHGSHTILFAADSRPYVILWGRQVQIDQPDRFGPRSTHANRLAFVAAYVNATVSPNSTQAAN